MSGNVGNVGSVGMSSAALGLGYVGVEGVSRLNPRAPDFAQRHPLLQHKHAAQVSIHTFVQKLCKLNSGENCWYELQQLFAGGNNAGNLSTLLMSYQQQPAPKAAPHTPHAPHTPQPHHPYQVQS